MWRLLLWLILWFIRPREAAMPDPIEQQRAQLEADITVAWATVQDARQRWAHSPNRENIDRAAQALAEVDELLEQYADLNRVEQMVSQ